MLPEFIAPKMMKKKGSVFATCNGKLLKVLSGLKQDHKVVVHCED